MPKSKLPKVFVVVDDDEIREVKFDAKQTREIMRIAAMSGERDLVQCVAAFALLGARVYAERCAQEKAAKKGKREKSK